MQSGTQLHLALLRKISQLMPTSNFRERFNQSKRRRQYFRGNLTQQSYEQEKNQPVQPLLEVNSNKTPSHHSKPKNNTSKRLLREENITISAWSIDEKDPILPIGEQEESRYEKKASEHAKMDLSEPKKRRNFSFNTNAHIKRPLPEIEFFRSPSHDQNARTKQDKQGFSRSRFSKIRHININLDKENQLSILEHCLAKSTKIGSVDKISSYDAFVNEMKMQERNRKLRN